MLYEIRQSGTTYALWKYKLKVLDRSFKTLIMKRGKRNGDKEDLGGG
jgi:hypothetical protein